MNVERSIPAETPVCTEERSRVFPMARPVSAVRLAVTGLSLVPLLIFALILTVVVAVGRATTPPMPVILAGIGIFAVAGSLVLLVLSSRLGPGEIAFEVGPEGLRVRSPIYGRTFPLAALRPGEARIVNLKTDPGLQPGHSSGRPLGINMPGCCIGSYQLRDRTQALLYLNYPTGGESFVFLPANAGPPLLLSPNDPNAFIAALLAV